MMTGMSVGQAVRVHSDRHDIPSIIGASLKPRPEVNCAGKGCRLSASSASCSVLAGTSHKPRGVVARLLASSSVYAAASSGVRLAGGGTEGGLSSTAFWKLERN